MNPQITLKDLEDHIEKLVTRGIRLDNYVEMLEYLNNALISENVEYLNWFPAFFGNAMDSFSQTIVIELANLLVKSRDDKRSLISFYNRMELFCGQNPNLIEGSAKIVKDIIADRAEIVTFESTIESILGRRNTFYAHMDKEYFDNPKQLMKDYPLTTSELRTITDFYASRVKKYYGYLFHADVRMKLVANTIHNLIELFKEYEIMRKEKCGI